MKSIRLSAECPTCASPEHVREKLILIDKLDSEHLMHHPNERSACGCQGDLSVDALKPEFVREPPLQQFVAGFYCERCSIGFIPEEIAKPEPQAWKLSTQGWHRVNPDGSLGPAQERLE
jgi:hypothetical protein